MRRGTLSQLIAPWRSGVLAGASTATAASVISLSLLPLAPCQAEIAHQGRRHEERDHGDRDGRPLAELAAGDAALEGEGGHEMGGVDRAAAGDRVHELEVGEGEQDR